MCLADTRRAEQQQRCDLQRVAAVLAQRKLALHVVEHLAEVGQVVVQVIHHRQTGRLDLKAFGSQFDHAFVGGAQVLVFLVWKLVELATNVVDAVEAAHSRNRDAAASGRHMNQFMGSRHLTSG